MCVLGCIAYWKAHSNIALFYSCCKIKFIVSDDDSSGFWPPHSEIACLLLKECVFVVLIHKSSLTVCMLHCWWAAKPTGVGPGLVFAASLLRSRDSVAKSEEKQPRKKPAIGLVPCAVGGTTMSEWKKGRFLYDRMIQRTKVAIEKGGTLKALLWYQGESDTTSKASGASFGSKLATFLQDIRTDLQSPDFPIIQVNLCTMI